MQAKTYFHHVAWEESSGISQGYFVNDTIYISGQFSHDLQSNFIGAGDIRQQTKQTLENLDRVLTGFGATKSNLAYVEIYLTNVEEHFEPCLELFHAYMEQHRPAGSLIGVTSLAFPDQLIEISAIAHADGSHD